MNFFKKNFILILVSLPTFAIGQQIPFGFFKNQKDKIVFTTSAQTVLAGNCSGITTVQNQTASGAAKNVSSTLTVNLTAVANLTYYSDSTCVTSTTSVDIASGTSSTNFYFISTTTGSKSLEATATAYVATAQNQTVNTNPFVWTGGGGDAFWSTGANWSGSSAPTASDRALFDSTCVSNCNPSISASISVAGIRMDSGYSGTITQNPGFMITVGSSSWVQLSGIFAGGNSDITLNGQFVMNAGTFTSTGATLTAKSNFKNSGGTWNHNNGTLYLGTSSPFQTVSITAGTSQYNNVTISGYYETFNLTGTLTVNGALSLANGDSSLLNSGTIEAKSHVTYSSSSGGKGSTLVKLIGTTDQTVTSSGTSTIGSLEIASTGGTVFLSGTLRIWGDFTWSSGVVDAGTSTVQFALGGHNFYTHSITPGDIEFFNVTFAGYYESFDLNNGTLRVNGTLSIANTNGTPTTNSGTLLAKGDVIFSSIGASGNVSLTLAGSTSTNLTVGAVGNRPVGNITINKTGGASVTMTADASFNSGAQDLIITAGTLNMAGYNLTIGRNISNSDILQRGTTPTCGTLTYGGSYTGNAAVCP